MHSEKVKNVCHQIMFVFFTSLVSWIPTRKKNTGTHQDFCKEVHRDTGRGFRPRKTQENMDERGRAGLSSMKNAGKHGRAGPGRAFVHEKRRKTWTSGAGRGFRPRKTQESMDERGRAGLSSTKNAGKRGPMYIPTQ